MEPQGKLRPILGALFFGHGLPLTVAIVLNFLRPDLMAPMLSHEFGHRLVLVENLLCIGATALYLVAALAKFSSPTPRVLIRLAGCLFFTLPALLSILFGPIVFVLLFGVTPS